MSSARMNTMLGGRGASAAGTGSVEERIRKHVAREKRSIVGTSSRNHGRKRQNHGTHGTHGKKTKTKRAKAEERSTCLALPCFVVFPLLSVFSVSSVVLMLSWRFSVSPSPLLLSNA